MPRLRLRRYTILRRLKIIREMMQRLPGATHYACFDTIFHQTMPEEAYTYPVPTKFREGGVRRYGFHGLSCESIVRRMTLVNGEVSQPRSDCTSGQRMQRDGANGRSVG